MEQQGESVPDFQPKMDQHQTRSALDYLKKNPFQFTEEQKANLEQHAHYYQIPYYDGEFNVDEAIWQAIGGFVEGFTTLNIADQPDNEYEAIIRNMGHLAGFAPGILAGPSKILGLKGAAKMFQSLNDKSVPMAIAKIATKKAKDIAKPIFGKALAGRAGAAGTVSNFIAGDRARHIMEGAFHLGVASSVSSWQGGVDQMMHAFMGGAQAGGIFRVIGNLKSANPSAGQKVIGSMAGSLFQGLPATMRGATTPEQIYEYLLGAYFGAKETPWTIAKQQKYIVKMRKEAAKNPKLSVAMDPEMLPEWKSLPPEVKPLVKKEAKRLWGDPAERLAIAELFAVQAGQGHRIKEKPIITDEGVEITQKYVEGERQLKISKDTLQKYKHYIVSGGSRGMEKAIAALANQYNIPLFHYVTKKGSKPSDMHGAEIPLTEKQLQESNRELAKAESKLDAKVGDLSNFEVNQARRNWHQVKGSDSVYIFGTLKGDNTRVNKGPGWAAQMAINNKKPVHVFDLKRSKWYSYEPTVNKFVNVKKPPKPPRRLAMIGEWDTITKPGLKEASSFFETHFKNVKKAKSEVDKNLTPEDEHRVNQILERQIEIAEELERPNTSARKRERLEEERQRLEDEELSIRQATDSKETDSTELNEQKDSDTDIGMVDDVTIGKTSYYFTDTHLSKVWKNAPDVPAQTVEKYKISQKIESLLKDYLNPGSTENRSAEWANKLEGWLQEKYGSKITLGKEARLEMRQWMTRRNLDKPVRAVSVDPFGKISFLDIDNPITKAGNSRQRREPEKILETVFRDAGGKGEAYAVLDVVTEFVKGRGYQDKSLSDIRREMASGSNPKQAVAEYKKWMGKVISQMHREGYHAFGGKADKDQVFFVRYHPLTDKVNTADLFKGDYDKSAKEFGVDIKTLKKGVTSNILYDIEMNGFKIDRSNVNKSFKELKNKVNQEGYIPNALGFNKRAQIWWNNSYPGDGVFITKYLKEMKGGVSDLDNGNFRYRLVDDRYLSKKDNRFTDLKNKELPEHVDGIIIVRDDVIDAINADAGMPDSGQNKSFIVSPNAKHGAMLGKYMMHAAGSKQTKMMQQDNLHFKIYDSAAKQRGERDYDVIYNDLSPEHIKYNMSTKQNNHMLEPQRIPKQLMGSLVNHAMWNIKQDTINDFFDNVIERRFLGTDAANKMLQSHIDLISSKDYSKQEASKSLEELRKNMDDIGIVQLLKAMRMPNNHHFTEIAWEQILKLNAKGLQEQLASGEIKDSEYHAAKQEINEFTSIADRMLQRSREWTAAQRSRGKDVSAISAFLHKFVTHYRMQAIRNYVVDQTAKPKIVNSGVARIRPYDKFLQVDADNVNPRLKELNTNDKIFFLDDAYKKVMINTGIKGIGRVDLQTLYDTYTQMHKKQDPAVKKQIEEIFNSVVMRVPMDSISGAHKLEFAGFTGRKGHGILMHSRAMRALGGADLDGDEAWFFMGGKGGFKPEWKEAFGNNKREFYKYTDGKKTITPKEYDALSAKAKKNFRGIVGDNKTEKVEWGVNKGKRYNEVLAEQLTPEQDKLESSILYKYNPLHRVEVSRRTVEGRNMLGIAVTQKQIMSSLYSALAANNGKETYEFQRKTGPDKWERYKVTIGIRKDPKAQQAAREMGRAQVALGSDPMDENGLKSGETWFKALWHLHFKPVSVQKYAGNVKGVDIWKKVTDAKEKKLSMWELKGGTYGKLAEMNSAFYGRDHTSQRKWSISDIHEKSKGVWDLDASQNNTLLTKVGRLLNTATKYMEDNLINRADRDKLKEMYDDIEVSVKGYEWLQKILGRNTFRVPLNNHIDNVLKYKLNTQDGRDLAIEDYKVFVKAIKGTMFDIPDAYKKGADNITGKEYRANIIKRLHNESNNFFINDITDAVTAQRIINIAERMNEQQLANLTNIHKKIEYLKKNSALMAKARKNMADLPVAESLQQLAADAEIRKLHEAAVKELGWVRGFEPKSKKLGQKTSTEIDQIEIDKQIREFKENLTELEKEAFDVLMLGSLNRGNLDKIDRLIKRVYKKDMKTPVIRDYLMTLRREASRTGMSRLGFQSLEISDKSIRSFLGDIAEKFDSTVRTNITEKEVKEISENIDKDPTLEFDGNREVQTLVEKAYEGTGYEGLKKGPVDAEMKKVILETADMLKVYDPKVRNSISELTRGLFGKELNAMNKEDFRIFRDWLRDTQTGTIWQRLFDKKGKLRLSKRHWYLFPRTISREQMKEDMQLLYEKGWFSTVDGKLVQGDIARPSSYIDIVQSWIGRMNNSAVHEGDQKIQDLQKRLLFVNSIEDGEALREIAVRQREKGYAENVLANNDKIDPARKHAQISDYITEYNNATKKYNWEELKKKEYTVDFGEGRVKVTGQELVKKINAEYTQTAKEMHEMIRGEEGVMKPYIKGYYDKQKLYPKLDYKKFIVDLQDAWKRGEDVSSKYGIDNLRMIAREMMGEMVGDPDIVKGFRLSMLESTGKIPFEYYWPHMHFNKKKASEYLEKTAKNLLNDPTLTKEDKIEQVTKLMYKNKSLTGDWEFGDIMEWQSFDRIMADIGKKKKVKPDKIKHFNADERAGAMFSRNTHVAGHSVDASVPESYIRSLTNTYYRQLSQIFSREIINQMGKNMLPKYGERQTQAWSNFMKLYVQGAMGSPDIIPTDVLKNRDMKLQGTLYARWADDRVLNRVNKIASKLGLLKKGKHLPKELRQFDLNQLRHWSNLEAQFEMASLLVHPKSVTGNIFGGTTHTIQSVGWRNWRNSFNYEYLSQINPEWTNAEAVDRFVVSSGIYPERMLYEFGLTKAGAIERNKQFIADVAKKMTRDPEMKEDTLLSISKKYGVTQKVQNWAAKWMSIPERKIRRDAFMAHYVHWWNKFGGGIKRYDDPMLLELARKGVKATQFLYSAPYRPAFSRTALGKVMTRFQTWSWNAVSFRNDVRRQARIYGYRPGTDEFNRFARQTQIDMFVFALGNIFAYSLFDTAMPAPYNWFEDTAQWLFGDEDERDKAFFGTYKGPLAPLQAITPPIARIPNSVIRSIVDDDYTRLSQYYVYTMFPFGRLLRDFSPLNEGNVIENPLNAIMRWTGMPLLQLQKAVSKNKKEPKEKPYPKGLL